jgi:hypothetical protein
MSRIGPRILTFENLISRTPAYSPEMLSGPLHQDAAAASHQKRLNQERGEAVAIYGERVAADRGNAGWQHPLSVPDN